MTTDTAVWYHARKVPVPTRRVLIRDLAQSFGPQVLLSTNLGHRPEQMLTWFIRRWTIELGPFQGGPPGLQPDFSQFNRCRSA